MFEVGDLVGRKEFMPPDEHTAIGMAGRDLGFDFWDIRIKLVRTVIEHSKEYRDIMYNRKNMQPYLVIGEIVEKDGDRVRVAWQHTFGRRIKCWRNAKGLKKIV